MWRAACWGALTHKAVTTPLCGRHRTATGPSGPSRPTTKRSWPNRKVRFPLPTNQSQPPIPPALVRTYLTPHQGQACPSGQRRSNPVLSHQEATDPRTMPETPAHPARPRHDAAYNGFFAQGEPWRTPYPRPVPTEQRVFHPTLQQTAFLVLLPRATNARLIAADLLHSYLGIGLNRKICHSSQNRYRL